MIQSYQVRYGNDANRMFLQHCLLSANQYQSWFIPTAQNHIDWNNKGWEYVMRLKDSLHHNYQDLESFTRALLQGHIQADPNLLFRLLTKQQQESMNRYYISHREERLLPQESFGDPEVVRGLFMFQSLWIGAGYPAVSFNDV